MNFLKYLIACFCFSISSFAISSEKRELIEDLIIKTSGGSISTMMEPMTDAMLSNSLTLVSQNYTISDNDRRVLEYKLLQYLNEVMYSDESINVLMDFMFPIYDDYFTAEELKELLTFYDTNIGKKTIAVMPLLMADSVLAGQNWVELVFLPRQEEFHELIETTLSSLGY